MSPTTFPRALTFAGAIPFVAATAALWFAPAMYRSFAAQVLLTYAAVIVSFLGGVQWGIAISVLDAAPKSARTMFALSVVPSLLAWGMLLLPAARERVFVAIALVAFVWVIDAMLYVQALIPAWFFRLRCIISAVVMASLVAAVPRV